MDSIKEYQIEYSYGQGNGSYDYFYAKTENEINKIGWALIEKKLRDIVQNSFSIIPRSEPKRIYIREFKNGKLVKGGYKERVA